MFNSSIVKKPIGLSLIELLLVLPIAFFIMSSTISIYLAVYKNFYLQSMLGEVQQNALTAIKLLSADLKLAGYIGCPKLTEDFPLNFIDSYELKPNNKIIISNNLVTVRHASLNHNNLLKDMEDNFTLFVSNALLFKNNDILIISNCKSADIFRVKKCIIQNNFQIISAEKALNFKYKKYAEVSKLNINSYYLDKTNAKSPALFMQDIKGDKIELVSGIEDMQINLDPTYKGLNLQLLMAVFSFKKNWTSYIYFRE